MSRLLRQDLRTTGDGTFLLQITSMVDMFTIILVFLLKSFSVSAVQIDPHKDLALPQSLSTSNPIEGVKMVVTKTGIFIEDKEIITYKENNTRAIFTDKTDPKFIPDLFQELEVHAKKSRDIAEVNKELGFDGNLILQADETMPYSFLKKVMYTSMVAGYSNIKLAVISKGDL